MATIRTAIQIYDGVTRPLQSMHRAMNIVLNSFESMQRASSHAVDVASIQEAREELARAGAAFDEIEQNVRDAGNQQSRFNRRIRDGSNEADGLSSRLKGIAATIGGIAAIKKVVDLSDTYASTNARLNLLVTDGGSLEELEQKIMASAQRSRSAYFDTASAVAKLGLNAGNAFDHDMDQVIAFMEQINKQFVIGGASAVAQSNAMIQLTQAMAAGALRGEELNSILDAAPGIARAIEQYMGVAEGSIKNYAEQGLVTAEVVKNAMFAMADETNAKFESMPMTWGQVFTMAGNIALQVLQPLLKGINWLANHISIIGPLVLGVGAAFAVFQIAAHWTQIAAFATTLYHGAVGFLSIAFGVLTGATGGTTAAVSMFNSVLLANPIVRVVMWITLLIGALYAGVAAYNKHAGAAVSATGIIAGAFAVLLAFIMNTFVVPLEHAFVMIANFIGNVFNDPVAAVKVLFYDMCLTVIGYIRNLAQGIENLINKIPGVKVSITSGLDNFYAGLEQARQKVKDESGWVEYVHKMDFYDYTNAASAGYDFGKGLADRVSKGFGFGDIGGMNDFNIGNAMDGIQQNTGDTAGNTAAMHDALDITKENLEYMRDIAEREAINRYTTAEIKIDQHNENHIAKDVDLDGILDIWANDFAEKLDISGEGVYV